MKIFYYTIEKQLNNYDDIEETNGWKYVNIYKVEKNKVVTIVTYSEVHNTVDSAEFVSSELERLNIITSSDIINLVEL